MIKRRTFVQGTAAAALGVPHLAGLAQQSVTLKFHTFMPPRHWARQGCRAWPSSRSR